MNPLFEQLFTKNQGSKTFLSFTDLNKTLTYDKFLNEIKCTANCLKKFGLEKGDCLVLQIEKSHHVFTIYGACVQLGVIFIPLNTDYTGIEVEYFLNDSECKIYITTTKMLKELDSLERQRSFNIETIDADYKGSFFSNFKIKSPFFPNSLTARSPNSNFDKLFLICEIFIFSLVLISIIVPPLKSTP